MGQFLFVIVFATCSILLTSSQSFGNTTMEVPTSAEDDVTRKATQIETPMAENNSLTKGTTELEVSSDSRNDQTEPSESRHDGVSEDRQPVQPPVWIQCLNDVTPKDEAGVDIVTVFKTWCRNQDAIIDCLSRDLQASAYTNPFDFFIHLNFDSVALQNKSQILCSKLEAAGSELSCASTQNESLSAACGHGFTRGLYHIFDIYNNRDVPFEVLEAIACDVTTQTTLCLKHTFPDCEEDVVTPVLNYYALFTNDTCIAQPGDSFPVHNPPPRPPETVVTKCAAEAERTLTPDESASQPSSLVDLIIFGLRADCKTYEARYECYHRELRNITNFMDFWLSLTFDYKNALTSQQVYCSQIEEAIIPGLTNDCFNQSQPALNECELGFSREVETIRQALLQTGDVDEVELQTIACRTSVTRAVCLGNAMQHCGADIAKAMSASEMGILPDICRDLLVPKNSPAAGYQDQDADNHQEGSSHADEPPSYGIQTDPERSHRGHDYEGIRENKNADGIGPYNSGRDRSHERPVNDMGYSNGTDKNNADNQHDRDHQKEKGDNQSESKSQHGDNNVDDGVDTHTTNNADDQHDRDHQKEKGGNLSASKSQPGDNNVEDGVDAIQANAITLYVIMSFMVLIVLRH